METSGLVQMWKHSFLYGKNYIYSGWNGQLNQNAMRDCANVSSKAHAIVPPGGKKKILLRLQVRQQGRQFAYRFPIRSPSCLPSFIKLCNSLVLEQRPSAWKLSMGNPNFRDDRGGGKFSIRSTCLAPRHQLGPRAKKVDDVAFLCNIIVEETTKKASYERAIYRQTP